MCPVLSFSDGQSCSISETGLRTAEIVTLHEEETIATDAGTVAVVQAWRRLLQGRG